MPLNVSGRVVAPGFFREITLLRRTGHDPFAQATAITELGSVVLAVSRADN
jgi:hypothetical protein